jgi:hypothetical protein
MRLPRNPSEPLSPAPGKNRIVGTRRGRGRRSETEPTAARRNRETGQIHPSRLTIPEEVPSPTPPNRRAESLAPSLAGRGHPREVHELSPRWRGERVLFDFPRVGRADLRPYVAAVARHPGVSPIRFLSGVRRDSACANRTSQSSRITCKTALFREPTSGLEPLTCSLRVIHQVLQRFARACKTRMDKPVSFLRLALCCTVLRSRWYQSGINITLVSA